MDTTFVFQIVVFFTLAALSVLVFIRSKGEYSKKIFPAMTLMVIFWALSSFLADNSSTVEHALLWTRLAIIGPFFFSYFFLLFSLTFPEEKPLNWKLVSLLCIPLIPPLFFIFTPYNVASVSIHDWGVDYTPGVLYQIVNLFLITYVVPGLFILIKKYRSTPDITQKAQIRFFLFSIIGTILIGLITNSILPQVFSYTQASTFGPALASTVFFVFTIYAIYKHHLFSVKVILVELLSLATWLILFIQLFRFASVEELVFQVLFFIVFTFFVFLLIRGVINEERVTQQQYEIIATISHQLRTPVTAINGYISILSDPSAERLPADKKEEMLEALFKSSKNLSVLVNDFLNVFEIENREKLDLKRVPLEGITKTLYDEFLPRASNLDKLDLIYRGYRGDAEISIDEPIFLQAISNLVENSLKYTESGSITISSWTSSRSAFISVTDTGIGFSKEEGKKLFQKFFRSDSARKVKTSGNGLGLVIVQSIIELHDGKISASSPGLGKGATFLVELPLAR